MLLSSAKNSDKSDDFRFYLLNWGAQEIGMITLNEYSTLHSLIK
ncbi:4614_t:CDS:2 [Cetraspora pellucida]|uniref:4614_t:CDS:1 n=1 Tax=Cetraspora pellucida TaxID=1433469 RepID=A0ACA9K3S9_9GLOM|nr:4614_t:CDS:2 [Cetraspora pellucida]